MVNAVDIIAAVVIAAVVFAVSFYLFAMYCHRKAIVTQLRRKASATLSSRRSW